MIHTQRGGSTFGLIMTLAILGYGAYLLIQYVPQHLEATTVQSILDQVVERNMEHHFTRADDVWAEIDKQLFINQMGDLKGSFSVTPGPGGGYAVTVRYERVLDLLFIRQQIPHNWSVNLR